ncbi:hypothetical protein FE257_006958 [Aspergillus nanangensis]|uniref:Metallo-beta-lactamase domain-containing protein n=1 Tax=Aspergillus nanangensis TaxID=2582783 RepID=A0AAD4CP80_ASPNN|nr:hypothetical protein FE257_006958 [Aspergillus nanangensis]
MDQYAHIVAFAEHLGPRTKCLPELPEVEKLTPRILRVLGGNPGAMQLQGTNTYILGTGAERLLIDSGQGLLRWAELISDLCEEESFTIRQVLLTHWHLDHTQGIRDLLCMNPDLKNAIHKYAPDPSQRPITDGQVFAVEGATLQAIFTPGHSTDHVCFLLQEDKAIFTGDTVLGHGTTGTEDLWDYMHSLEKLAGLSACIGYPGHGAVILDLQQKIQQEITLKKRREQQVIVALEQIGLARGEQKGLATQAHLIEAVFGQIPDVSRQFLDVYMRDLLMKLAREKRVAFKFRDGQKHWFVKVQ